MSAAKPGTLNAAGLAKVTIVFLDEAGNMRTTVHVLPRGVLARALQWMSKRAVG